LRHGVCKVSIVMFLCTEIVVLLWQKIVFLYRDETEPEMIADETVEKPEGWLDDEPELVADPSSERPEDWYFTVDVLHR